MNDILEQALKELETQPEAVREYFARWISHRVDEVIEEKKRTGRWPKIKKRILKNSQKDFIDKLRIKHGMMQA